MVPATLQPKTVTINIPITADPVGQIPVVIGVQGVFKVLERGMDVEIPYAHYIALQNAKELKIDMKQVEGKTTRREYYVPSYPFNVVKEG